MLLNLRVDRRPRPIRVVVEASPGATFAELRDALALPDTVQVAGSTIPGATPLGRPPLLDHAVISDPGGSPATSRVERGRTPELALLRLYILDGPDSGRVFPLAPGLHTIGRSNLADLTLIDPTLSRLHATIEVTSEGASIRDCGSTNPGFVQGSALGKEPVALQPGQPVQLGQTRFELRTPSGLPATVRPDGEGHLVVSRSPRMPPEPEPIPIEFPTPPNESDPTRLPTVGLALPLVIAGLMAVVLRSPTMLLFGLMSPALVLGTWWQDRRTGRRSTRAARTAYRTALQEAEGALSTALQEEQVCRRHADPHPAALLDAARSRLTTVWDRDLTAGLTLRIGTGRARAQTPVRGTEREVHVEEVPIVVNLQPGAGLGVVASREVAARVVRAVVGCAVVRHSPSRLGLVVDSADDTWSWTSRLPHRRSGRTDPPRSEDRSATLVLVDCSAPVGRQTPLVLPDGALVVAMAPTRSALPAVTTTVVDFGDGPAGTPVWHGSAQVADLVCDGVAELWGEELADALAPLRDLPDRPGEGHIPDHARLVDLLDLLDHETRPGPTSTDAATARTSWGVALTEVWAQSPARARLPIGVAAGGSQVIDLDADGPHFLVGGTTGSGKSEFLVSLVAAAAALNRPDELCFVLVDYKGGAAFGACRDLPHVVGMVTDLDQHLAERALASLTAELRRRERLLADAGCPDLATYRRRRPASGPRIARLVIVIDEFRSLADELPDLMQGLVRIAALGRSLGVHLVIATQRPGGAITADMRANLAGRIALRVRDAVDSLDVLGVTTAADLPHQAPGRAILASAATPATEFQTARVTAPVPDPAAARVRVVSVDGIPLPLPARSGDGPTDLDLLVAATREAAAALEATPPPSPWLPPLPTHLRPRELPVAPNGFVIGLLDDPTHLQQRPWAWDPIDDGALAIVGSARSGRSSTLRTLAHLVTSPSPHPRQLYAVHTGALADLEDLPLCGASVPATDVARVDRLLDLFAAPSTGPLRRILLVDDWERVIDQITQSGQGGSPGGAAARVADRLQSLVRDAADGHLDIAVAGGRALLTGAMSGRFGSSLLLLPADSLDLACAGLRPSLVPSQAPTGRAIDPKTGLLLQLAHEPGEPGPAGHELPVEWVPPRVPALPTRIGLASLTSLPGELVIGTGGHDPVGLSLANGSRRLVVVGASGSGRSTALRTIASALSRAGMPVALVTASAGVKPDGPTTTDNLGSALESSGWVARLRQDQVEELVALRREHPELAVLVDDAQRCDGGPIDVVLREIARLVDQDHGFIALATTLQHSADAVTSLAGTFIRSGEALLLGALPAGFERSCGLATPAVSQAIPGRGYLVRHGIMTAVQVAVPDAVSSP